jgi:hypothetical protein
MHCPSGVRCPSLAVAEVGAGWVVRGGGGGAVASPVGGLMLAAAPPNIGFRVVGVIG